MKQLVLILALACGVSTSIFAQSNIRYVTAAGLNLRADESADSKVLTVLKTGDAVELLGYVSEELEVNGHVGNWVQVNAKGKRGYVFNYHLSETKPGKATEIEKVFMYVTAKSGLRLRENDSMESKVLATIPLGTKVEVLEVTDTPAISGEDEGYFIYIKYGKLSGFVHSNFLSETK